MLAVVLNKVNKTRSLVYIKVHEYKSLTWRRDLQRRLDPLPKLKVGSQFICSTRWSTSKVMFKVIVAMLI